MPVDLRKTAHEAAIRVEQAVEHNEIRLLRWGSGIALVFAGAVASALIILSREILVSGLREFLAGLDVSVPVSRIAKAKTAIQMIAIGAMILRPLADGFVPGTPATFYSTFAYGALWLAAALTVYTGYIYFRAGLAHVRPARATHGEPV